MNAQTSIDETSGPTEEAIDVRAIAFYLPQFHPTPENDEWWGKGFTEWRNVTRATPLFEGHYQPHLPGEMGYYDLRLDEVRRAQVDLARKAGLSAFCFYYYWFNGRRILEMPLNRYVADKMIDFPFCICWANENWSRLWDGGNREVLLVQEHDYESDMQFIRDVIPLLKDPRYVRIDGKPLLILYRQDLMKDARQTAAGWRAECEAAGLPGVYLCCVQSFKLNDPHEFGFDAACEFPPHQYRCGVMTKEVEGLPEDFMGTIYDYDLVARQSLTKPTPPYKLMRGIFPGWDNSARKRQHALVFHHACPESYEYWLRGLVDYTRRNLKGEERIIFINAWNEWAEGAHLEPDLKFGRAYIEATRCALTQQRDAYVLLATLQAQIEMVQPKRLRRELAAYLEEARAGYETLDATMTALKMEKATAERMALERSSAIFLPIDLSEAVSSVTEDDVKYYVESLNGRPLVNPQVVIASETNYLRGWMFCDGIVPEAPTTSRFLLLRSDTSGQVYAAQVNMTIARNDVARSLPAIPSEYSINCGFFSLFSFSRLPEDTYVIGAALFDEKKTAASWSNRKIKLEN